MRKASWRNFVLFFRHEVRLTWMRQVDVEKKRKQWIQKKNG